MVSAYSIRQRGFTLCRCGLVLLLLGLLTACWPGQARDHPEIAVRDLYSIGETASLEASIRRNILYVDITNTGGIGRARLVLKQGKWPKILIVRLWYPKGVAFNLLEGATAVLEESPGQEELEGQSLLVYKKRGGDGFVAFIPPADKKFLYLQWVDVYRN